MNQLEKLLLRRRKLIVVGPGEKNPKNQAIFLAHLFQAGFVLENPEDYTDAVLSAHNELMTEVRGLRGDSPAFVPLFSNFPDETPDDGDYFLKRLVGYVINHSRWNVPGEKLPGGYTVPKWLFDLEMFGADPISQRQDLGLYLREKFKQLTRGKETPKNPTPLRFLPQEQALKELEDWVRWCLTSSTSFPEFYRGEIEQALGLLPDFELSGEQVPFREHRAVYSAHLWRSKSWGKLSDFVQYPTDLLRLMVQLTGGDVSFAEPVFFPKLKRAERRRFLSLLEPMKGAVAEDQLQRYRGLWLALERSLHSGEYKKLFPSACELLGRLRRGELKPRFSTIESAYATGNLEAVLEELKSMPGGVSLRRFCHTLSLGDESLEQLLSKVKKAALKDQLMLKQVLKRDAWAQEVMVLTKRGATQVIPRSPDLLSEDTRAEAVKAVTKVFNESLQAKYGESSWEGRTVYVDPALQSWVVPTALRSASDSLTVLGRGSVLKLAEADTLRMFVYWKQNFKATDLDLSAVSFDKNFRCTGHVSWTNLKASGLVHSGDLQSAPHGATEFIDAKLETLKKNGHRYLGMLVHRYCGEHFGDMECFCGWMMRDKPDARYQTFDIATVSQKLLLTGEATYALPVLFDLERREALWFDFRVYGTRDHNQVEDSWGNLERLVRVGTQMKDWKTNLYQLGLYHAELRGATLTADKGEADLLFTEDSSGDYNPGNWSKILSELL